MPRRGGRRSFPGEPAFGALVDELERASPEFRAWWPEHAVQEAVSAPVVLLHPQLGALTTQPTVLHPAEQPEVQVTVYIPVSEIAG